MHSRAEASKTYSTLLATELPNPTNSTPIQAPGQSASDLSDRHTTPDSISRHPYPLKTLALGHDLPWSFECVKVRLLLPRLPVHTLSEDLITDSCKDAMLQGPSSQHSYT